jgi:lauroyl/myristoyl acyltransferase
MSLKSIISSPRTMRWSMHLSQHSPERLGPHVARLAASIVGWFKPAVYQVVHANLRQVLGPDTSPEALDQVTRRVFYNFIRNYIDLFRALRLPQEELATLVELSPESEAIARSFANMQRGTVLVSLHLGNFDLAGQVLANRAPAFQVISLPDPPPGFQWLNEVRHRSGAKITPLSSTALREAIGLLRSGGVVCVAGDRPVSELDRPVPFFGRPARVPSGHVRLTLQTGADLVIAHSIFSQETQKHVVHLAPPLEMIRTGNRKEDVWLNMRQVLDALEEVIRRCPEQWYMFVPVWPELLNA